ncbi:D-alanyl-D-alanine carboxypeptidase family protein [uncultured Nitratireductor sp.]|uniref:D-alanyl-D-alanine carboxypeptidase family protein n=1 Tax=uncultured Nitratireductor sp. TaxID=520953 RepID=UPI0025F14853|nr:D-alanyl-D-alanine carboxypeptidase family protein [uncultured Nitratireductor sp.]
MGVIVRQALLGRANLARLSGKILTALFLSGIVMLGVAGQASANSKYAGIVMDAKTGKVLYESHADSPRYPASLTKMMTAYMLFEALSSGRISKDSRISVSRNAAAEPPTNIALRPGDSLTVDQAIRALVTRSANDVATAVAEFLGGSESKFASMMTAKARSLGMSRTTFKNAHGLPNSQQKTTARDMAKLSIALREHYPRYYSYFQTKSFTYKKRRYGNHNRLLGRVKGVDGIKTGYTRASGFNLASSVQANGRSIVAVVMGGRTSRSRDAHMADLIKRYLNKGSTGRDRMLIAKAPGGARTALAAMIPGNQVPLPTDRPEENTLTAYAPEQPVKAAAVVNAAVPRPRATVAEVDPMPTASTEAGAQGSAATGSIGGWVIQVASMPSEDEALMFLAETEKKAGKVLARAVPITETFEKGGTVYHRARFVGFENKSDAWGACASLKKQSISCYAVQQ